MPFLQFRDHLERKSRALKAVTTARRPSFSGYRRGEFDRITPRPSNAEILERLARLDRRGGPAVSDTVAEIRRTLDYS